MGLTQWTAVPVGGGRSRRGRRTLGRRALDDPGYVATSARGRSVPRGMLPDGLCPAVSFLCSRSSGFITGQSVVADGWVTFL
ncbi:hypothetical protein ACI784_12470 [Geodermatophilus sp. SYSU D01186]